MPSCGFGSGRGHEDNGSRGPLHLTPYASNPDVAMDGNGNATIVWGQRATRYRDGAFEALDVIPGGDRGSSAAMPLGGDALVVTTTEDEVNGVASDGARGWRAVVPLDTTFGSVNPPDLVTYNLGSTSTSCVVWRQAVPGADASFSAGVFAARHLGGSGWQPTLRIDRNNVAGSKPQSVVHPRAALGGFGLITVAWAQVDTLGAEVLDVVRVARYDGAWTDPEVIAQSENPMFNTRVAMDALGNSMVIWAEAEGLFARRYDYGSRLWGAVHRFDLPVSSPLPDIDMDALGNAMLVWSAGPRMAAAQYLDGIGWQRENYISSPDVRANLGPNVAVDGARNARAVWRRGEEIRTARFSGAANTWLAAETIGTGLSPSVAMDRSGVAVAAWVDGELRHRAWRVDALLSVGLEGLGRITSDPPGIDCGEGGGTCEAGFANQTVVTLTITPAAGQTIGSLGGVEEVTGTGPFTATVTMDGPIVIYVGFVPE